MSPRRSLPGMSLVEIVVAMGIVVLFTTSFVALVGSNYSRLELARDQSEAAFLMQEGATALRSIAASNWAEIVSSTDDPDTPDVTTNGLERQASAYAFMGTEDVTTTAAGFTFTRRITIEHMYREPGSGDMIEGGDCPGGDPGVCADDSARLVTIDLLWQNDAGEDTSITTSFVVSRWSRGAVFFDTQEDLLGGGTNLAQFHNAAATTELFNGEVRQTYVGNMRDPEEQASVDTADPIVDVAADGDDLFVLTSSSLRHYSLQDISTAPYEPILEHDAPSSLTFTSLAVGDDYLYIGDDVGAIRKVDRSDFTLGTAINWSAVTRWQYVGSYSQTVQNAAVRHLLLSPDGSVLYLGRDQKSEPQTYEFQIVSTTNGSAIPGMEAELESVTGIATDGGTAYVSSATKIHILDLTQASLQLTTVVSPFLSTQTIHDVALDEGYLYAVASESADSHELTRVDVTQSSPTYETLELGETARRIKAVENPDWIVVLQENPAVKVRFIRKNGPLAIHAQANLAASVDNTPCRAVDYEKDRLYAGCASASAPRVVTVTDASTSAPVRYADYASYVSPVACVSTANPPAWEQFAYRESGEGLVQVSVRAGDDEAATRAQPWSNVAFSSDALWYDLSAISLSGRCVQFRAVFAAAPACALYMEYATFTYAPQ